ncbi:MAG: hypothetical protein A2Y57_02915 [Candidatus Woykebacteria bacterium RBG_13_40_7b]|uniref:Uncharacterized protein n=1 Tax=Candidatus Woykebacteria bacterium RBG_13_40_7b TaxID=1802594 RepID=A0A1G1W5D1_9BACT|nr:MAG: hypothetical protein A2Y57_02915 [Candidatus Woykebacteria bacterium RBG_13_40_7b]
MENLLKKQVSPNLVGLLQSLGVAIYCLLIGSFFFFMEKTTLKPGFLGIALMLILLVFSASITGSIVFAYPAYLCLNKKIKESLEILAYTLLYSLIIILLILFAVIFWPQG